MKALTKISILAGSAPLALAGLLGVGLLGVATPSVGQEAYGGPCAGELADDRTASSQLADLQTRYSLLQEKQSGLREVERQFRTITPQEVPAKRAELQAQKAEVDARIQAWPQGRHDPAEQYQVGGLLDLQKRQAELQGALNLLARIEREGATTEYMTPGDVSATSGAAANTQEMQQVLLQMNQAREQAQTARQRLMACQQQARVDTQRQAAAQEPAAGCAAGAGAQPGDQQAPGGGASAAPPYPGAPPTPTTPSEPPPVSTPSEPPTAPPEAPGEPSGPGGPPAAGAEQPAAMGLAGEWISNKGPAVVVINQGDYGYSVKDENQKDKPWTKLIVQGDTVVAERWGIRGRLEEGRRIRWDDGGWTGVETVWVKR